MNGNLGKASSMHYASHKCKINWIFSHTHEKPFFWKFLFKPEASRDSSGSFPSGSGPSESCLPSKTWMVGPPHNSTASAPATEIRSAQDTNKGKPKIVGLD